MSSTAAGTLLVVLMLSVARSLRPGAAPQRSEIGQSGAVERVRALARHRAASPAADEWAAFLDTTSTEVRSGSSLAAAISHARLRHPRLAVRFERVSASDPEMAVALQSLSAALELGGPVAATLHQGAALLRERSAQIAEARAHSAQARLSASMLTAVPLVFAGWSLATSATFRGAVASSAGLAAAGVGLACNLLGWWWMNHIVGKATT